MGIGRTRIRVPPPSSLGSASPALDKAAVLPRGGLRACLESRPLPPASFSRVGLGVGLKHTAGLSGVLKCGARRPRHREMIRGYSSDVCGSV